MSPWKVILATLVIFCSGLVTGALMVKKTGRPERPKVIAPAGASNVSQTSVPSPQSGPQQQKEFLQRMDKELKLSAEQRGRIEKVLKQSHERTKQIRDQIAPELKDELKRVRSEMRTELSPEQQKKFDDVIKPKLPHKGGDKGKSKDPAKRTPAEEKP